MKKSGLASVPAGVDVLILDNRDSFTWNIAQGFLELGATIEVVDSAEVTGPAVLAAGPRLVCIGPGPRGPAELPHLIELARGLSGRVPILGVCLGMQVLVRAHGGSVGRAKAPVHGKRDAITHDGRGLFRGLPSPLWVMRYHSLVATAVPARFAVVAEDAAGQAMAIRDPACAIEAVQFHPESIGTAGGLTIFANALAAVGIPHTGAKRRVGGVPGPHSRGPGHEEAMYGRAESPRGGPCEPT